MSGLISAIELSKGGYSITLIEKKAYPFHRVCGEYISNEVLPYFEREGLMPAVNISKINRFEFSSINGTTLELPLDLGGFGISRYQLDYHLAQKAKSVGVHILEKVKVVSCEFQDEQFTIETSNGQTFHSKIVIGAYGKKSVLDNQLQRGFTKKKSPYIGVKYHIKTDYPKDLVSLHNFQGGYCGISAIEDDRYNLCYLGSRKQLKKYGSIQAMEEEVLCRNPHLKQLFQNSEFLFDQPEVINEFSFASKKLIENHILMAGDSAGLITPLCGNGMAMAIHSGKILAETINAHYTEQGLDRQRLEATYLKSWNGLFKKRLWVGRQTQKLFGSKITSGLAVHIMKTVPPIAKGIMKNTHGEAF